uniref:AlNc14C47G3796 protein n=1 Tax=Albugo laibachii Nc14 TaxID=890382 RepID=F0WAT4_9STRA|nr:AlNc14C47G3796 [Albugo laibachii Nc14]|eukprot:CCA18256.1 AlNc14C47G3796 [Albugo laibachii Nc14]
MIALAGKEEKDLIYFEQNATIKRAQESVSGMQAWSILEHYVMEFVASNDWCISSTYGVDVHQISDFQKLSNRPVTVRVTRHPTSEEHATKLGIKALNEAPSFIKNMNKAWRNENTGLRNKINE